MSTPAQRALAADVGIRIKVAIDTSRVQVRLVRPVVGDDFADRLLAVLWDMELHIRDLGDVVGRETGGDAP